jgi:hypothetical protein
MKQFIYFLLFVFIFSCKKKDECLSTNCSPCQIDSTLNVDLASIDLFKYVLRDSVWAPYSASAVKEIPRKGAIEWQSNNSVTHIIQENEYYLKMANFGDTSWVGYEFWAFTREVIGIKFNPFKIGKQKLLDESSHAKDSKVSFSSYILWSDDVINASWNLDLAAENYIKVTHFDKKQDIVEGTFLLHFNNSGKNLDYADKAIFRCGKFKAKIYHF